MMGKRDANHVASQELFETMPDSSQSRQVSTDEPTNEAGGSLGKCMHTFVILEAL